MTEVSGPEKPRYLFDLMGSFSVLIGVVVILQVHSIAFWIAYVGALGWAWSVLLEACALWLWYQPSTARRFLGILASALVLLGPLYHVSEPLIEQIWLAPHSEQARQSNIALLQDERRRLEENLAAFRSNSAQRSGWLPAIENTETRLQTVDVQLAGLMVKPPESTLLWRDQGLILMQSVALILFQIVSVLSITTISRLVREAKTYKKGYEPAPIPIHVEPEESEVKGSEGTSIEHEDDVRSESAQIGLEHDSPKLPAEPEDKLTENTNRREEDPLGKGVYSLASIKRIHHQAEKYMKSAKLTQAAFAKMAGVAPRDLSFLRTHEERVAIGERTISEAALMSIEKALDEVAHEQ